MKQSTTLSLLYFLYFFPYVFLKFRHLSSMKINLKIHKLFHVCILIKYFSAEGYVIFLIFVDILYKMEKLVFPT